MKGKKKEKDPQEVNTPPINPAEEISETETPEEIDAEVLEPDPPSAETQLNQAQDQYKRTLAEFDNYRKRTIKEMAARYEDGQRAAADKLLPIIDNFERALNASENKEDNFYQGIALIARQFENVLSDIGIEQIAAEPGTAFDHNLHHAVAHVEDEAYGQNEIVDVLQKGYKHRDKVLRPSMVKVAN
ncbi:MAG: nucleotide exchange factor GrpE [Defluviitaleaceae bacterium]|nr:nucleotide exchange factor GrpE [Defluviitaleaceae bacterium]